MHCRLSIKTISLFALGLGLLAGGAAWFYSPGSTETAKNAPEPGLEPPPIASSPFLNTGAVATYVGSAKCAECHPDQHRAFQQTTHSQALDDVDVENEPPDGEFLHAASSRRYKIYRRDGQLRHAELLDSGADEEVVLSDYPMRYTIGSGHHSRSYLVEVDGFLVESPATWYAARQAWDISPGFDSPENPGFARPVRGRCLHCHVGRMEVLDDSMHRIQIHEQAIGCERCHGPGSLHVERREADESPAGGADPTIVHLGRLSRRRSEDVCSQCHLSTAAAVDVRTRRLEDFRPGLALNDFCIHYAKRLQNRPMTVVGHVEQMRLSRCYTDSETLTCITCHHPHEVHRKDQSTVSFNRTCLECHQSESCGLPRTERLQKRSGDDCIACHMPKTSTDIPHFAFTHHRIGIHRSDSPQQPPAAVADLVPLDDVSDLPEIERLRCLGLAYLELARDTGNPTPFREYYLRAQSLLEDVHRRGIRDVEVASALAQMHWERKSPARAMAFASEAAELEGSAPMARAGALFIVAESHFRANRPAEAIATLEQLMAIRRHAEHWVLLSRCRYAMGEVEAALGALRKAAEVSPARIDVQQMLAGLYEETGDAERAGFHRKRADQLASANPPRR